MDGGTIEIRHDSPVDLRPVVWDATVVTPRDDRGVTIVMCARYRTLEEICTDRAVVTRSLPSCTPARHGRVDHDVRPDHTWTEAAFA